MGGQGGFAFDPAKKSPDISLTNADKTATRTAGGATYVSALALAAMAVGDVVYFTIGSGVALIAPGVGLGNVSADLNAELGSNFDSAGLYTNGDVEIGGGLFGNVGFTYTTGDVIGVKLASSTQMQVNKNGGAFTANIPHGITGTLYAGTTLAALSSAVTGA